jgi:L-serine dehydratase
MEGLRQLYRSGYGPSSSHTMGPRRAAEEFSARVSQDCAFRVTLYGSLAATGKGHLTREVLEGFFAGRRLELHWEPETFLPRHPNALRFEARDTGGDVIAEELYYSVGGGQLKTDMDWDVPAARVYPHDSMDGILRWCRRENRHLWEYVYIHEGAQIEDFLDEVWRVMVESIERGVEAEGVLPGELRVPRKASSYLTKAQHSSGVLKHRGRIFAYALAVSEENAAGGRIVTAPTCGSCGVVPAVLYYLMGQYKLSRAKVLRALAAAGLLGCVVKERGSISGAEVGCQGEIGTACAMAAAAAVQLMGGSPNQAEYAAEMGIEHHLGLTCDPVKGYVQIPCIERNAVGAGRAVECAAYAALSDGRHRISLDEVIATMVETGRDLNPLYRETSTGGLAKHWREEEGDGE